MKNITQMRQKKADEAKDYLQKKINKDKKALEAIESLIDENWFKGSINLTGYEKGISLTSSVLKKLRLAGYETKHVKGFGIGGVDSYDITWSIEAPEPPPVDPSTIPYDDPVCCFTHDDGGYR